MKGPSRPAPKVPPVVHRYSPVTNWDQDPFGTDVFEPTPHLQKKKPPPRPPPPKVNVKQPDVPTKPSHFIRRPTVLSSLLSRKQKPTSHVNQIPDFTEHDTNRMFPKCEPKNVQMGALIDLSSPPSSPTFTTRSSSDGLSVDSFGSDATTSTNHLNNCGSASQAESGFEDDFDLFLTSRKMAKEDTLDSLSVDPFSPVIKPPIMKKPVIKNDAFGSSTNINQSLKGPTIIRAKPARPKPPDNSAILKTTFGNGFPSSMTVNTTMPIHKVANGFGDSYEPKPSWDTASSPDRESSPPMPSIPPPPPPNIDPDAWPDDVIQPYDDVTDTYDSYYDVTKAYGDVTNAHGDVLNAYGDVTGHTETYGNRTESFGKNTAMHKDVSHTKPFSEVSSDIKAFGEASSHTIFGNVSNHMTSYRDDSSHMKPFSEASNNMKSFRETSNNMKPFSEASSDIKPFSAASSNMKPFSEVNGVTTCQDDGPYAIALFDYATDHPDDLCFSANTKVNLIKRVDNEWLYGSLRNGAQGLFPSNYVEIKVPLPTETLPKTPTLGKAVALYDFEADQPGDLKFVSGSHIIVLSKLNDEWYYGECGGRKGQFPLSYVRMSVN